jgi:phosphomannomutase
VHTTVAVTRRVDTPEEAAALMAALRSAPPDELAGIGVTMTDLASRTDAVEFSGGDDDISVRVVTRPSGTEPKLKSYIEIRCTGELSVARARAAQLQNAVVDAVRAWV